MRRLQSLAVASCIALAACSPEPPTLAVLAPAPGCAAPAALADRDDDFSMFGASCASEASFTEGGTAWSVATIRSGRPGPLFVVPHDDEDAALGTAAYALGRYGGAVTAVETGGSRFAGRIDPNRNFDAGPLACGRPGRSERFVAAMLEPGGRPVVALHTNERGVAAAGGSGSVSIRAPYAGATAFPAAGADEDAMVILAARGGADDPSVRRLTDALNARGINVLVERVDLAATDCSMSHYAVAAGLPYANVEARDGDGATQRAILDALMPLL